MVSEKMDIGQRACCPRILKGDKNAALSRGLLNAQIFILRAQDHLPKIAACLHQVLSSKHSLNNNGTAGRRKNRGLRRRELQGMRQRRNVLISLSCSAKKKKKVPGEPECHYNNSPSSNWIAHSPITLPSSFSLSI
ncbi:hypothetical protein KIL84_015700 [Mauremys mutica]|uniref:Uncharacterized protein n=1 Tax=Mauremys mutica TaxID=74926 RepID=A0A9D4APX6_9SAUR|nr:hypothetical protein KIL84_015700 [Mauremys mutica]